MSLFIGVLIGWLVASLFFWLLALRDTSPLLTVDRYWLENPDRWEWLRRYERGET